MLAIEVWGFLGAFPHSLGDFGFELFDDLVEILIASDNEIPIGEISVESTLYQVAGLSLAIPVLPLATAHTLLLANIKVRCVSTTRHTPTPRRKRPILRTFLHNHKRLILRRLLLILNFLLEILQLHIITSHNILQSLEVGVVAGGLGEATALFEAGVVLGFGWARRAFHVRDGEVGGWGLARDAGLAVEEGTAGWAGVWGEWGLGAFAGFAWVLADELLLLLADLVEGGALWKQEVLGFEVN